MCSPRTSKTTKSTKTKCTGASSILLHRSALCLDAPPFNVRGLQLVLEMHLPYQIFDAVDGSGFKLRTFLLRPPAVAASLGAEGHVQALNRGGEKPRCADLGLDPSWIDPRCDKQATVPTSLRVTLRIGSGMYQPLTLMPHTRKLAAGRISDPGLWPLFDHEVVRRLAPPRSREACFPMQS